MPLSIALKFHLNHVQCVVVAVCRIDHSPKRMIEIRTLVVQIVVQPTKGGWPVRLPRGAIVKTAEEVRIRADDVIVVAEPAATQPGVVGHKRPRVLHLPR